MDAAGPVSVSQNAMRVCPRCTLFNPDTAVRCDCGFDFSTASLATVRQELAESQRLAVRGAVRGLLLGIGAVALSLVSRMTIGTSGDSTYYLLVGLAGFALAGRSLTRILDIRKYRKNAEAAQGR